MYSTNVQRREATVKSDAAPLPQQGRDGHPSGTRRPGPGPRVSRAGWSATQRIMVGRPNGGKSTLRRIVGTENITLDGLVEHDDTWFDPTADSEQNRELAEVTGSGSDYTLDCDEPVLTSS